MLVFLPPDWNRGEKTNKQNPNFPVEKKWFFFLNGSYIFHIFDQLVFSVYIDTFSMVWCIDFFFMKQCNILLSGDYSTEGENNLLLLQITEFSWSKAVEVSFFASKALNSSSSVNIRWGRFFSVQSAWFQ